MVRLASGCKLKLVAIHIIAATTLYGCSTTNSIQDCSPRERNLLSSKIAPITKRLNQAKAKLDTTQRLLTRTNCASTKTGNPCKQLLARKQALESEIQTLSGTLTEIEKILANKPVKPAYVKQCSVTFPRSEETRKTQEQARTKKPAQKTKPASGKKDPYVAWNYMKLQRIVVTPPSEEDSTTAVDETAPKPARITVNQPLTMPKNLPQPAPQVTGAERAYTANPKVRVVGPAFLPDPSQPEAEPAPAHEAVP
ncbi:hypothetical protein ACFO1V_08075 [Daeguia caeni]|uniref:Uncharacterized protein n=1 Tax=Daeguia caeni TaxID=439612 RepID=A0ABV9H6M7_9HYPH